MAWWDNKWATMMEMFEISCQLLICYIDDIRIYLRPIKYGWYCDPNDWFYDDKKVDTRDDKTRTVEEISNSNNSIFKCLKFTMETECELPTGWLPTLDTQTQVQDDGEIFFMFFNKPTGNNIGIQFGSALPRDTFFSSLRQETVRRMVPIHKICKSSGFNKVRVYV